jgi:hypothetical protein
MILKRLLAKDPDCWRDWPAVRASIEDAALHFNQKACPVVLDLLLGAFVSQGHHAVPPEQQDRAAAWYIVDDAGRVRGHLFVLQDTWDTEPVVFVHQLWGRGVPRTLQEQANRELNAYAASRGVEWIMMYTRRIPPPIVRAFRRLSYWSRAWNFEPYRLLSRRRVVP